MGTAIWELSWFVVAGGGKLGLKFGTPAETIKLDSTHSFAASCGVRGGLPLCAFVDVND